MSTFKKSSTALLLLTIVSTGAFAVSETSSDAENDALAVTGNKITLSQAIASAEKQVNGQAANAEFKQDKSGAVYDIEIVKNSEVYDVTVDAQSGAVLSSALDKTDRHSGDDDSE